MLLTIFIALLSLVALMVIHEFGHFIIAKKFGVRVEEFGIGYPPRLFGKKFGETLYSVNLVPFGAFVKIHGEEGDATGSMDDYRSFANLTMWKRMLIVLGGVLAFWLASIVIFSAVFLIGASIPVGDNDVAGITDTSLKVAEVDANSPAQMSGLRVGDTLLTVEIAGVTTRLNKVADFQKMVKENAGNPVIFTIVRNGQTEFIPLIPRVNPPEGQGPTGIALERVANVIRKAPWYEAPFRGVMYTGKVTVEAVYGIYAVFANLFSGKGMPQGAELAGPIGITIFLARAVEYGPGFFLYFIGSLSVLIALFNVFPIPALDGGKLLFLIIEKVRKKPVPVKTEQIITIACFALLITMSVIVTIKFDIPRVMEFWRMGS